MRWVSSARPWQAAENSLRWRSDNNASKIKRCQRLILRVHVYVACTENVA